MGGDGGSSSGGKGGSTSSGGKGGSSSGGSGGSSSGGTGGESSGGTGGSSSGGTGGSSSGGTGGSSSGGAGGTAAGGSGGSSSGGAGGSSSGGAPGKDGGAGPDASGGGVTFTEVYSKIMSTMPAAPASSCQECHGTTPGMAKAQAKIDMSSQAKAYEGTIKLVKPGQPATSMLYIVLKSGDMPEGKPKLSATLLKLVSDWIMAGAMNN